MKKLPFVFLALILVFFVQTSFAQSNVEGFIQKSNDYRNQQKFDEAIAELSKAVAFEPNNVNLYLLRANLYFLKGDANGLLSDVQRVVSLNPTHSRDLITAVVLLFKAEKCSDALNLLDSLITKDAKNAEFFSWRFHVKACLRDELGAFDDITKAVELDPKNTQYRSNQAGLLSRLGNSEKALQLFEQLINSLENQIRTKDKSEKNILQSELGVTLINRSKIYEKNGDLTAMFTDLTRAVEIPMTENLSAKALFYFSRALAFRKQKMFDKAAADYTEAMKLEPENFVFLMNRADAYLAAQKYPEAIADYEQLIKLKKELEQIAKNQISYAKKRMEENASLPK
jgi:tetratricopeptide (TPR) repeat protein